MLHCIVFFSFSNSQSSTRKMEQRHHYHIYGNDGTNIIIRRSLAEKNIKISKPPPKSFAFHLFFPLLSSFNYFCLFYFSSLFFFRFDAALLIFHRLPLNFPPLILTIRIFSPRLNSPSGAVKTNPEVNYSPLGSSSRHARRFEERK